MTTETLPPLDLAAIRREWDAGRDICRHTGPLLDAAEALRERQEALEQRVRERDEARALLREARAWIDQHAKDGSADDLLRDLRAALKEEG